MRKKLWINLALMLIIPGLLLTVSCAKKTVKKEASSTQEAQDEAAKAAAEKAKQEELAKQRAIQEENLNQEARMKAKAKDRFLNEKIYFDFDSSTLTLDSQEILKEKAQWLRNNPGVSITIAGNCDERGTVEYNLALGERRAMSAKAFLVDLGIKPSRITTLSYGEERPADPGHNEAAWAKNRRDDFIIQ